MYRLARHRDQAGKENGDVLTSRESVLCVEKMEGVPCGADECCK